MYSTTTIMKNPKLSGKHMGTHQQLDKAARQVLARPLGDWYFPTAREIIYFEGMRGPDGLKRKSPNADDPSHMLVDGDRQLIDQIFDHYHNLVQALRQHNDVRAAFEAAWMAHKITDALTPAHHFPLDEAKEELMSNKEFFKIFGEPIKGIMHGHNMLETARNNWLYWGAGGYMSKHVAYEYGVAIIAAALPQKAMLPRVGRSEFRRVDPRQTLDKAIAKIQAADMYTRFCRDGWTTDLALDTKNLLLPEIIRTLALIWYAAAAEAHGFRKSRSGGRTTSSMNSTDFKETHVTA